MSSKSGGKIKVKSIKEMNRDLKNIGRKIDKGFTNGMAEMGKLNPITQLIKNKNARNLMIDSGELTNDYLLPATVSTFKPIGEAFATFGGPAGNIAYNQLMRYGLQPVNPEKRQKSKILGDVADIAGNVAAEKVGGSVRNNGWIHHVKTYAAKNKMNYKDALKCPKCKASYKKGGSLKRSATIDNIPKDVGRDIISYLNDNDDDIIQLRQSDVLPENKEELTKKSSKIIANKAKLQKRDLPYIRAAKRMINESKPISERIDSLADVIAFVSSISHENMRRGNRFLNSEESEFIRQQSEYSVVLMHDGYSKTQKKSAWDNLDLSRLNKLFKKCLKNTTEEKYSRIPL